MAGKTHAADSLALARMIQRCEVFQARIGALGGRSGFVERAHGGPVPATGDAEGEREVMRVQPKLLIDALPRRNALWDLFQFQFQFQFHRAGLAIACPFAKRSLSVRFELRIDIFRREINDFWIMPTLEAALPTEFCLLNSPFVDLTPMLLQSDVHEPSGAVPAVAKFLLNDLPDMFEFLRTTSE